MTTRRTGMRRASSTVSNSPSRIRVATPGDIARVRAKETRSGMGKLYQSGQMTGVSTVGRGMTRTANGDMQLALPKEREPFDSFTSRGIPWQMEEMKEREKVRQWCRGFYKTRSLVAICIDIYSRFPVQGIGFQSKDNELTQFYETLFLDQLNYEEYLIEMGREYWTVGEVNSLASWNDALGVWDYEEVLDPDDIEATFSPFEKDYRTKLRVPAHIREIIETQEPKWEYEAIAEYYPELLEAAREDEEATLEVSPHLLSRMVNKTTPWDAYGTPHMMRCFRELLSEESLNAAQDAVADRLYSPFILAKLGIQDIGDGEPWIPQQGDIDAVRDNLQAAMAADFRLLVHHFGIDIESVFGREAMPRFGDDYDRIEKKILQTWGIGEDLISGGTGGTYASSALNQELVTQLMSTSQKQFKNHYEKRAAIVAEAQGHFDYEDHNGKHTPVYEEVLFVDPDTGEEFIEKKPKLLFPEIHFATLNLRDEDAERQFLMMLRQSGVPLSDEAMMINIPYSFEDELQKVQEETIKKTVTQQETNQNLIIALTARGLPLTPELQQMQIQQMQYAQMLAGQQGGGGGDDSGGGGEAGPGDDGGDPGTDDQGGDGQDQQGGAPTSGPASAQSNGHEQQKGRRFEPRNQLRGRPEVSDSARGPMPKARSKVLAMYRETPKVMGMSRSLPDETIAELVERRPWTAAIDIVKPEDPDTTTESSD